MVRSRAISVLLASVVFTGLTGCGGSGGGAGGGSGNGNGPPPPPSATIAGVAGAGPLLDAIISFYSISNGVAGTTAITTVRTDSKTGAFSASVSASGPVLVTVTTDSNTQMLDELSGTPVAAPSGLVLHTMLDSVTSVTQSIAISPLTEMAYQIANAAAGGLTPGNNDAALTAVDNLFLNGAPALYTPPIAISVYKNATAAEQELAKLSTALAVAANDGTATDTAGSACNGTNYGSRLTCALAGLGNLVQNGTGSSPALTAAAHYFGAAYTQLDNGDVQINGGQPPSALGLDTATQAETALLTALASQSPFPGYSAGGTPVANTKALFADVRTNILDVADPANPVGLAPMATAVATDVKSNVSPPLTATARALIAARSAADLLVAAAASPQAASTADINAPVAIAVAADGNFYVANFGEPTIVLMSSAGQVQPFADTTSYAPLFSSQGSTGQVSGLAVGPSGGLFAAYSYFCQPPALTPPAPCLTGGLRPIFELNAEGALAAKIQQAMNGGAQGIAFDAQGNLYFTAFGSVMEISSAASSALGAATAVTVATVPPSDTYGSTCGIAVDAGGNIYFSNCYNAIYKVLPSGSVTLFSGAPQTSPITGPSTLGLMGLAVDGTGDVYAATLLNSTIVKFNPAGVMSVVAGQAGVAGFKDGQGSSAVLSNPSDVKIDAAGNLYVADYGNNAIRRIDPQGNVTTAAKGSATFRASNHGTYCAYGPSILGTAANVAQCVYTVTGGSILMTVTQTGSGAYDVKTQPLSTTPNPDFQAGQNPVIDAYQVSSADPPLDATLTVSGGGGPDVPTGSFSGQVYVSAAGGSITASVSIGVSSNWNASTDSGTITLGGSLSNGQGGIGLQSATIGSDSSLTVQNVEPLLHGTKLSALTSPASVQGTLDITGVTTSSFVYGGKVTIGAPVADKSGKYEIPSSLSVTGTIAQVASAGGTTPLFTGSVDVTLQGIGSYDATQPYSATNYATATATLSGNLSLSGGRVLDVSAEVKGSQSTPTPAQPDSVTATYSYSTPAGTLALNATGTYDTTNGVAATVTNNSGVTVTLSKPMGGTLTGTATVGGQKTATISGSTIDYSDGTSESLY